MPRSNVEIHRLIALPASAVLLVALRKLRARHPHSGLHSGRR